MDLATSSGVLVAASWARAKRMTPLMVTSRLPSIAVLAVVRNPLALWSSDLPILGRGLGEVHDHVGGSWRSMKLVHGQSPDSAVCQVQTGNGCLDPYLVQEVVDAAVAVNRLDRPLVDADAASHRFGWQTLWSWLGVARRRRRSRRGPFFSNVDDCGVFGTWRLVPPLLRLLRQGQDSPGWALCLGLNWITRHRRTSQPQTSSSSHAVGLCPACLCPACPGGMCGDSIQ